MSSKEIDPLLRRHSRDSAISSGFGEEEILHDAIAVVSPSNLYHNFVVMSIFFSINHGCVVACLAYATTMLGDTLGGYGSGALYICYALTAFFLSKPVVSMIGPKNGLLVGVAGYCVYVTGFLCAILAPSVATPVFIAACVIGGIAGGLLWTSQGRYFAKNAKLYSEFSGEPVDKVNASFAGVFAFAYLGLENVTKVLATIIWLWFPDDASFLVFSVYSILAFISCFVIASIDDLNEIGSWDFSVNSVVTNSMAAGAVVVDDIRLALMIPFQVSFGLCSSFVPYYVLGTIIADSSSLGDTYVGLLSSLIVLTGAIIAMPASWAANAWGKMPVMVVGGLCLSAAGGLLFVYTDEELGTWGLIVPYLIIYGVGRGTWENTNKAVIADLFSELPEMSTAAFAAIAFSNGLAGAIGYFIFGDLTRSEMAGLVMAVALFAVVCFLFSSCVDKQYRANIVERLGGKHNL